MPNSVLAREAVRYCSDAASEITSAGIGTGCRTGVTESEFVVVVAVNVGLVNSVKSDDVQTS